MSDMKSVNIIGAGLAGLSAAITLARAGVRSYLISSQPSERAQSVLAEGGINAALDTMGENDSSAEHFRDTMKGGCFLASEKAVSGLTEHAPMIVKELAALGVPFNAQNGRLLLRNFGGQKKKRTAFAKSSTGKMIMTALIDEARKYEAESLIRRFSHHELIGMEVRDNELVSVTVQDSLSRKCLRFTGSTILCTGGLNGFFEGLTTGTTQNTGNAAAIAFCAGAEFANLEFIQYHPTTVAISGKRMLISEAARGEGGRLYIIRDSEPWYFMEEKYPELGNLMPRDVISREMTEVALMPECTGSVMLDLTGLSADVWSGKLSDLRSEILSYMNIDPKCSPVPVSPGIHYFMGGIRVNVKHETNLKNLFAAGESACQYHGANRLGGNSMLGALYGGKTAALSALETATEVGMDAVNVTAEPSVPQYRERLCRILASGLGIIRNEESLKRAVTEIDALLRETTRNGIDRSRTLLGKAMLLSALERKESRGAHTRSDYPETSESYRRTTVADCQNGEITVRPEEIDKMGVGSE